MYKRYPTEKKKAIFKFCNKGCHWTPLPCQTAVDAGVGGGGRRNFGPDNNKSITELQRTYFTYSLTIL